MINGFEIKVPITLKGGKEGEKVGKQIGSKVAEQIGRAFKMVGIGKQPQAGGGTIGMLGVTKGLKGVAMKLGIIAGIATVAIGLMKKASPYLQGILNIFGRAFMIFFRPFGDFLATLLRPMAILMMKMAIAFLKWTRNPVGKAAVGAGLGAGAGALGGAAIGALGGPIGALGGAAIGAFIGLLLGIDWKALGEQISRFAGWIWENLLNIWDWTYDFGGQVWSWLIGVWNYVEDFGSWMWVKLTSIWNYKGTFGKWIWDKLKTIWDYTMDFGSWLWEKLKSIWSWSWDFGSWLWEKVTSAFKNIGSWFGGNEESGGLVGIPFVPGDGMYKLHRGEQVIRRGQSGKSVIFKPTFQINSNGVSQDIDMDAIVRRAGRMTEMDLKQRGII